MKKLIISLAAVAFFMQYTELRWHQRIWEAELAHAHISKNLFKVAALRLDLKCAEIKARKPYDSKLYIACITARAKVLAIREPKLAAALLENWYFSL